MASKRKLIGFDAETLQALDLLSRDSGKSIQELAEVEEEAQAQTIRGATARRSRHHRLRVMGRRLAICRANL